MKKSIIQIIQILGEEKRNVIPIIFFYMFISFLDVASLSLIFPYISIISKDNNDYFFFEGYLEYFNISIDPFHALGISIIFLFLIKFVFIYLINKKIVKFSLSQVVRLKLSLFKKYQYLDYLKFKSYNKSDLVNTILTLTSAYSHMLTGLLKSAGDIITGFFIIIFLAYLDLITLSFLLITLVSFFVIFDKIVKKKLVYYNTQINLIYKNSIKILLDYLNGFKEIRIRSNEDYFFSKMNVFFIKHIKFGASSFVIQQLPRPIMEAILVIFLILLSFFYMYQFPNDNFLALAGTFVVAALRLFPSANSFLSGINIIRSQKNTLDLLSKDLNQEISNEWSNNQPNQNNIKLIEDIKFDNVSFTYNEHKDYIIKSANISLPLDGIIGVQGSSGSGKTTFIEILLGLLKPTIGYVKINKKNIEEQIHFVKKNIYYLPQNVFILQDTIKENIIFDHNENLIVNEDKIFNCLKNADLKDFVLSLEKGVNTIVGDDGSNLSGGQKQRLGLARALYSDRQILILDESTNALDDESENLILNNLKKNFKGKLIIIITHKSKVIDNFCDYKLALDKGNLNLLRLR